MCICVSNPRHSPTLINLTIEQAHTFGSYIQLSFSCRTLKPLQLNDGFLMLVGALTPDHRPTAQHINRSATHDPNTSFDHCNTASPNGTTALLFLHHFSQGFASLPLTTSAPRYLHHDLSLSPFLFPFHHVLLLSPFPVPIPLSPRSSPSITGKQVTPLLPSHHQTVFSLTEGASRYFHHEVCEGVICSGASLIQAIFCADENANFRGRNF